MDLNACLFRYRSEFSLVCLHNVITIDSLNYGESRKKLIHSNDAKHTGMLSDDFFFSIEISSKDLVFTGIKDI